MSDTCKTICICTIAVCPALTISISVTAAYRGPKTEAQRFIESCSWGSDSLRIPCAQLAAGRAALTETKP